jgi:hypothetical protein
MDTPDRDLLTERVIGLGIAVHRALGQVYLSPRTRNASALSWLRPEWRSPDSCRCPWFTRAYSSIADIGWIWWWRTGSSSMIKSVERLLPIHDAQVLTYLRLSGRKAALLMNFNVMLLKDGIRRFVI